MPQETASRLNLLRTIFLLMIYINDEAMKRMIVYKGLLMYLG